MCIIYWRLGGESFRDPNREIDFGFVFVHVSCVRAKLCAMIPLWLGAAKLFSPAPAPPAPPAPPVGGRTSRDVPTIKTIDHGLFITKKVSKKAQFFQRKISEGPGPGPGPRSPVPSVPSCPSRAACSLLAFVQQAASCVRVLRPIHFVILAEVI